MSEDSRVIFRQFKIYYEDRNASNKVAPKTGGIYEFVDQPWENGYIISYDPQTWLGKKEVISLTKSLCDWEERTIIKEIDIVFIPYYFGIYRVKKSLFDNNTGIADPSKLKNPLYVAPNDKQLVIDPITIFFDWSFNISGLKYDLSADDDLVLIYGIKIDRDHANYDSGKDEYFAKSQANHADFRIKVVYSYGNI